MSGAQPEEFSVRRYAVLNAAAYVRETFGPRDGGGLLENLSPRAKQVLAVGRPADWAPITVLNEITDGIAAQAGGDNDKAREMLITCGIFMAREATNTFFKMLLKIITPQVFCKKLPDFWNRDFTHGKLFVEDLSENRFVCRMEQNKGFHHGTCTAAGFTTFVLTTMGKEVKSTMVHGWSLSEPCKEGAKYEVIWT